MENVIKKKPLIGAEVICNENVWTFQENLDAFLEKEIYSYDDLIDIKYSVGTLDGNPYFTAIVVYKLPQ